LALKVGNGGDKARVGIDRTGEIAALDNDVVAQTNAVIILSKGRCLVDNSRSARGCDVGIAENLEGAVGTKLIDSNDIKKGGVKGERLFVGVCCLDNRDGAQTCSAK